jgi:hypothetical protein
MIREEQIRQEIDYQLAGSFGNYPEGYEEGFIEGAKWADANPNLYNDEKYHTVKVSCLDELNRKAKLYDEELVGMGKLGMIWKEKALLKKVYDWLDENWYNYCGYTTFNGDLMIEDLKREMEE